MSMPWLVVHSMQHHAACTISNRQVAYSFFHFHSPAYYVDYEFAVLMINSPLWICSPSPTFSFTHLFVPYQFPSKFIFQIQGRAVNFIAGISECQGVFQLTKLETAWCSSILYPEQDPLSYCGTSTKKGIAYISGLAPRHQRQKTLIAQKHPFSPCFNMHQGEVFTMEHTGRHNGESLCCPRYPLHHTHHSQAIWLSASCQPHPTQPQSRRAFSLPPAATARYARQGSVSMAVTILHCLSKA